MHGYGSMLIRCRAGHANKNVIRIFIGAAAMFRDTVAVCPVENNC